MSNGLEADRLRSLASYNVLDTPPEAAFDRLTSLAAELFETPIALISLIEEQRQWFKSRQGLDATSTPRQLAFCAHAIQQDPGTILVVEDASLDARFMSNPLVTSEPHIRFYAGAVLTSSDGYNLGTLCVIDSKPRVALTPVERRRLSTLAQIVVDELELRKARLEVHEKSAILDLAEHIAGLGRWRFDVASRKVSWSDEMYRIHGLPVGGDTPDLDAALAVYPEQDQIILADQIQRAISTGQGYEVSTRLRRCDGEVRNIIAKAKCVLDEFGAVQALVGVFQDVTEHVQAAHFLRTITDNIPSQIAYWDKDLKCRFANAAYKTWFALSPDEMLGMSLPTFLGPSLFELNEPFVRAAMRGERQTFERTLTKVSGEIGHVWTNYIPDFDDAGDVRGMFVLITDVTTLKSSELRLHQANVLLAAARDKAEAATLAKSEFLANMSHEIRTPLTAIIGFARLLKDSTDVGAAARVHVSRVANASQALLSIVNDVLDFSKLEAGQVRIEPRPSAPSELLRDTLAMFVPMAEAKGLALEFAERPLPDFILIDPDKTRQILINLIGNAVKFTDVGSIRLTASYDEGAARLDVSVEDTGSGLTPAQHAALFQRFSQVDGSSTRRHGGTGLGLAICKGLTAAMGGDIGVCSDIGEGSTFHFHIRAPLAAASLAAPEEDSPSVAPLDGVRVLVVDDNSSNRELVRIVLEQFGAVVTEADDGFSAVEFASKAPADVILLDLHMPKLSGVEVLARIRAGEGPNRDVPILAFTADCAFDRHSDYADFNGLVHKPLSPGALMQALLEALELCSAEGLQMTDRRVRV